MQKCIKILSQLFIAITCFGIVIWGNFTSKPAFAEPNLATVKIVSRAQWRAHTPKRKGLRNQYKKQQKIRYISIHHTVSRPTHPRWKETDLLRFIQNYHQRTGFRDIAYHYLVGHSGKVYKGRNDDIAPASFTYYFSSKELIGARWSHGKVQPKSRPKKAPGNTDGHITVAFLTGRAANGKPRDMLLPKKSMRIAARLIAELLIKYDLTPQDVRAHREIALTKCPGSEIYRWLRGSAYKPNSEGEGMRAIKREYQKLKHANM